MSDSSYLGGFFVADYSDMCDVLTRELVRRGRNHSLAVAVFASAHHEFTRTHLLPHVEYWNCRSRALVDFFFLGYRGDASSDEHVTPNDREDKGFDEATFVRAIEKFEESGWQYSGRPSIVIFESVLRQRNSDGHRRAFPNMVSYIEFEIQSAIEDRAIGSVEVFFEKIVRFAKTQAATGSHWRLSDLAAAHSIAKALGEMVFENLPIKGTKQALAPLKYFRVRGTGT
jgi:hypothetical protein